MRMLAPPAPTVTATSSLAWLPAASNAVAVILWGPLAAWLVSHCALYGALVSVDNLTPSIENSTRATPTLSDAVASMLTVALSTAPAAGDEIFTVGLVGSPMASLKALCGNRLP